MQERIAQLEAEKPQPALTVNTRARSSTRPTRASEKRDASLTLIEQRGTTPTGIGHGSSFGATPSKQNRVGTPTGRGTPSLAPNADKLSADEEKERIIKKFKFDNQLLMRRLSEYKKAEKGAVEMVKDYAAMRFKYEKVLEENKR